MQNQKLLPLIAGCMAIFIKGENTGKVVRVLRQMRHGDTWEYNGKKLYAYERHDLWWHVEGATLSCLRFTTKETVETSHCFTEGDQLMRIDGGSSVVTCEDVFLYPKDA